MPVRTSTTYDNDVFDYLKEYKYANGGISKKVNEIIRGYIQAERSYLNLSEILEIKLQEIDRRIKELDSLLKKLSPGH